MNNVVFHWENRVSINVDFTLLFLLKFCLFVIHFLLKTIQLVQTTDKVRQAVTIAAIAFQANQPH